MARPKAKELTERELEIMHVFWEHGPLTAHQVRDALAANGRDLAYTTVATLIKILIKKEFIEQTNDERPFLYRPIRSFRDVSGNLLSDVLQRVFHGSKEQLLIRLLDHERLTPHEAKKLRSILNASKRERPSARKKK